MTRRNQATLSFGQSKGGGESFVSPHGDQMMVPQEIELGKAGLCR